MTALKMLILMTVLTGLIYPLTFTALADIFLPKKSFGELVEYRSRVVGAKLIAQGFIGDKFFWPRPSSSDYDAKHSGGSNLGPTSRKLKEMAQERASFLARKHFVSEKSVPTELIYASGSGLDPHISVEAAYFQADRVARARFETKEKIEKMIDALEEGGCVNVLLLNKELGD